ncbi:hypothetical protein JK359_13685 [Streptomyces actinomycinicus]|uniref:Oligosaccharide repeat unit polymerase n=1 Tax=Streptomyces actinomycinicus TaxID=1695166 RepID=A0A937JP24_9ACTN|nr:hypothetical protein [Streptomyces actinomycinicus]MBL1083022.1 hypothetical protein [Streptomyces actinomycinicus]
MRHGQVRCVPAVCCWALVLTGLLPLLILQSPDVRFGAAPALQYVVVAHSGGALTRVLTDTRVRLAALGFWLFTYVWLGLAPLAMLATGAYPHEYRADDSTSFAATALIELGLLAYSGGAALAGRRPHGGRRLHGARRSHGGPVSFERLLSRRLAPWPVLLLSALVAGAGAVLIPRLGGVGAFFTSRQAVRETGAAEEWTRALAIWALAVPAFWALVGLLHLRRAAAPGDRLLRNLRLLLLPLLVVLNAIVNNPISRPRFWAGTVLLVLLCTTPRFSGPTAFRRIAAGLTVAVLLVFPYGDYFRYDDREAVRVVSLTEQFTANMDYDAYQQVQTGVDRVAETGFAPSAALGAVLFAVPRSVWPEKPRDTGMALADWAGYAFKNLSAPLWIESYLWAGLPAVAAVFTALGAAGRRLDDIRDRARDGRPTLALLLVPAFAVYQMILLRGSLMGVAGPLMLLLGLPLFLTSRAPRSTSRLPRTASRVPQNASRDLRTASRGSRTTSRGSGKSRLPSPVGSLAGPARTPIP